MRVVREVWQTIKSKMNKRKAGATPTCSIQSDLEVNLVKWLRSKAISLVTAGIL